MVLNGRPQTPQQGVGRRLKTFLIRLDGGKQMQVLNRTGGCDLEQAAVFPSFPMLFHLVDKIYQVARFLQLFFFITIAHR